MVERKARRARVGARRGSVAAARTGTTLIETTMAIAIVVLVLGGFSRSVQSSVATAEQHAQTSLALAAARRMVETLQAEEFSDVFALFNSNPDDFVDAPGPDFDVAGLQAAEGDEDGLAGEIVFPTQGAGANQELREDLQLFELGLPRDLNGDGAVDDSDHSEDYALLPVIVRVRWRTSSAPATVEIRTLLADY